MNGLIGSGRWFDEVRVGDTFASALTITETHIVMGAGLIGDFNPHHVNAEYAKGTRFGTPILHGMLTSSIMGAAVGMYFHGTAVAYVEHRARFIAPVRAGDAIPIQLNEIHSFENPGTEPLEFLIVGVSRDNTRRVDLVEVEALRGR